MIKQQMPVYRRWSLPSWLLVSAYVSSGALR